MLFVETVQTQYRCNALFTRISRVGNYCIFSPIWNQFLMNFREYHMLIMQLCSGLIIVLRLVLDKGVSSGQR